MQVRLRPTELSALAEGGNLFQSSLWGQFKSRVGWQAAAFSFRSELGPGRMLLLSRPVAPGLTIAYVPYGPALAVEAELQGFLLESLSRALSARLRGCLFVRYDLPWRTPYAVQSPTGRAGRGAGAEAAVPLPPPARIRELRMNFGTRDRNLRKAPTDVLPPDTVLVDLTATEGELLARMKPKTRYNVRLASRRGVKVQEAGEDALDRWYRLYAQTARRHRIVCPPPGYFRELFRAARRPAGAGPRLRLLLATAGGRPAAGAILALHDRRATYLYGASSRNARGSMPAYRLQWRAMQIARALGCESYDLFGIPPADLPSHPMHGLYRFKTGFGGRILHRRGCWDYPFRPELYDRYRGAELGAEGYHPGRSGGA